MDLYKRVLDDLSVIQLQEQCVYNQCRIKLLRYKIMFILPFWNSRLGEHWEMANTRCTKDYDQSCPRYSENPQRFFIYLGTQMWCSLDSCHCWPRSRCLWHDAIHFYAYKQEEEQSLPKEEEVYDWMKFTEQVVKNLDTFNHTPRHLTAEQAKQIRRRVGLSVLRSFRMSMAKWNFEDMEEIKVQLPDLYRTIEIVFRRSAYFFGMFVMDYYDGKELSQKTSLDEMLESALQQAKVVYLQVLPALKLIHENGLTLACETLCSYIDDLKSILDPLLEGLRSSPMSKEIQDMVVELIFIRSVVNHTLEQPVVSGLSYAIATHIDAFAGQASDTLCVNFRHLFLVQQMITNVRKKFRKTSRSYSLTSCYIDDLLSYLSFIEEDDILRETPTADHLKAISLLHTFIKDTEYVFGLNPEANNMYCNIAEMFSGAWWDLRSLCFRNLSTNKDGLPIFYLDFLKGITTNMPQPKELLLVLIQPLVQMPFTKFLLHHLHIYLVPTEEDGLSECTLNSRGTILVQLMESHAINLIRDIDVESVEAVNFYDLFIRELKDIVSSSTEETAKRVKASIRQAYVDFLLLSDKELSELEFFDMIVSVAELKKSDAYFPICTTQQIGLLHDDLFICGSFLRCYAIRFNRAEKVEGLWSRIMKLGRQINNFLYTFEQQLFPVWFYKPWLLSVVEEVKLIKEKISESGTFQTGVGLSDVSAQNKTEKHATESSHDDPHTQDKDQLLLFDEEDRLMKQLTTGSKSLEKFAVVGMPGLGKTTLAMNVYRGLAKFFNAHAWCYVGQESQRKELLRDITSQISDKSSIEITAMQEEDLKLLLKQSLHKKKNYLIILDDVWNVDAWNALQVSFPERNNGSRILLTSRSKSIGESVCGDSNVLELNLLSTDKSWNLLQSKVYGTKTCPQNLCKVGIEIAEKCGGLPLSIVVIAGVLKNMEKTEDSWYQVAESIDSYLVDGVSSTLELSYKHLSVGMKQCFLYCKTFLKGKEIPKSKLVRLWLAERFVEESDKQESLEDVAYNYLCDLVDRSLLIIAKKGSDNNGIQTCRIHDLLREFCIQKANEEKFMITIDGWDDPASRQWRSRLCFSSTVDEFVKFKCEKGSTQQTARSLIFSTSGSRLNKHDMSFIFDNFRSLTLLNLENIEMGNAFGANLAGLKLLRYLAVRGSMKSIPSSIGELLNLETLVVRGKYGEIDVPDTVFNLSKLRHVSVNARARVCVNQNSPDSLSSLQSFSTPALSGSTGEQIIIRLLNIRKLRCIFLDGSFSLSVLDRLTNLEFLRVFYHGLGRFHGKLSFPSNLYKLTLSKFRLPWSEIEKIATLLPRLKILQLLFKAFEGNQWTTTATFQNLKYLRMEELDIQEWEASDDNFPGLERLVVRRCKLLQKIPEDLGNIAELMGIEAHWCSASVGESVLKIKRQQSNDGNMQFEAVVYPTVPDLSDDENCD